MGSRPRSCASDEGRESCKVGVIGSSRGLRFAACFVRRSYRPRRHISLTGPLTVGRTRIRSVVIYFGSRVFFSLWRLVGPSQDGERAERLINTLFGAKDGGQHRQERALALTSLRCTRQRCVLATLSYDNMAPGFWTKYLRRSHIVVASSSLAATSYHTTQSRQRRCALLMMTSFTFGAERRIFEPLSARAVLTRRHREIKHPRPKMFGAKRVCAGNKCNAGLTRSGSTTKSTVYNSKK